MPTTTIALMNPDRITIATDGKAGTRFIHSLSDEYPVGVVIECDNDDFESCQWADIVKMYRDEYGDMPKEMKEWAASFSDFLIQNHLCHKGERKEMLKKSLLETFSYLVRNTCDSMNHRTGNNIISEDMRITEFKITLEVWLETYEYIAKRGIVSAKDYSYDNLLKECDDEIMDYLNEVFGKNGFPGECIPLFLKVYHEFFIYDRHYCYTWGDINLHFFGWGQCKKELCECFPAIYSINIKRDLDMEKYRWAYASSAGFSFTDYCYLRSTPYKIFHRLLYVSQWYQHDCVNRIESRVADINKKMGYSRRYRRDVERNPFAKEYIRHNEASHTQPLKSFDYNLCNLYTPCRTKGQVKLVKEFIDIAFSTLPGMEGKVPELAVMDFKRGYIAVAYI